MTAALATLASLEGSPGPAAALARPTGGLMLIDAFTLVGLAGKYASRSGAARLPLGEKVCRPQIGSGLRTRLRCRLARAAAALASSRRGRSAIVRTGGRLATSISTHATRSASAGGCRKSGWLTAASRRLPDRRVQNCVREIGIDNKHGRSVKAIHSFLSRWRAGTELCAGTQQEPCGKKSSMGSENGGS